MSAAAAPVRLAVLGDPLLFTRSPELHRAGLQALGLAGDSEARRTPAATLPAELRSLARAGFRGASLTHPLKEPALLAVDRASADARAARSINTVGFDRDGIWGESTDGPGFLDLLESLGVAPARVVLLGAGGAARSLALALARGPAPRVVVAARRPADAAAVWGAIPGATLVEWRSAAESQALGQADLVVHCTPLAGAYPPPAPLEAIAPEAAVIDLVYGADPTPWVLAARASGRRAWDGLGLLVFQARRALGLWFGREVPVEPLARAVGWPR